MASAALSVAWGGTGSPNISKPFDTFTPDVDLGMGFGDLPPSLIALRPFAMTAEVSLGAKRPPHDGCLDKSAGPNFGVTLNPTVFNWVSGCIQLAL